MPNQSNILSPISLIAFGRSGTSLLQSVFSRLPHMNAVGETTDLIFGCWDAVHRSIPVTVPKYKGQKMYSEDELTSEVIQNVFLNMFPDTLDHWFQKPIGIPKVIQSEYWNYDWETAAEIYWSVMTTAFPKAKFFTILRHPCDVVLSSKSYWGWPEASIWRGLGLMSTILASNFSHIEYAVLFDDLVNDPEPCLKGLFDHLEIDYSKEVLKAFDTIHVPSKESKPAKNFVPSREDQWVTLNPKVANPLFLDAIQKAYNQFGYYYKLPAHIEAMIEEKAEASGTGKSKLSPEAKADKISREIARLKDEIRRLHTEYSLKIKKVNAEDEIREVHTAYALKIRKVNADYEQKIQDLKEKNKFKDNEMSHEQKMGFQRELTFWDRQLSLKGPFKEVVLTRLLPERFSNRFPHYLLDYVNILKKDDPEKYITIVDIGSGPLSLLVYGHYTGQFNLTAVDPLAGEYKELLAKYEYEIDYPLLEIAGEDLEQKLGPESFDIVWCRNALDHTQNPKAVFDQMVSILKPGGFLMVQSSSMEGRTQNWRGLHQHDIYLETNYDLMCRSMVEGKSHTVCLDCNQPLEVVTSTEPTQEPGEWVERVWKKVLTGINQ